MCMWQSMSKISKRSHRTCLCQSAYSCPASYAREWLSVFTRCTPNPISLFNFSFSRTFVVDTAIHAHSSCGVRNAYLNYTFASYQQYRGEWKLFKFSRRPVRLWVPIRVVIWQPSGTQYVKTPCKLDLNRSNFAIRPFTPALSTYQHPHWPVHTVRVEN